MCKGSSQRLPACAHRMMRDDGEGKKEKGACVGVESVDALHFSIQTASRGSSGEAELHLVLFIREICTLSNSVTVRGYYNKAIK